MQLIVDTEAQTLTCRDGDAPSTVIPLYSKEAFEALSRQWLKVGWSQKYSYDFTWLGRPMIQLPEDMLRAQEVIWRLQPDVIVETGVAHGGSLIYYASLCQVIGHGRVVGVDIEIRPHNRAAIEEHPLTERITLLEGDSTAPAVVAEVAATIGPTDTVLVFLDSCHTKAHVAAELEAYHGLATVGSYIVATDGIMGDLGDVPGGDPSWRSDHPAAAARGFAEKHPEFELEQPPWPFHESELTENVTYWPAAWLRRVRQT